MIGCTYVHIHVRMYVRMYLVFQFPRCSLLDMVVRTCLLPTLNYGGATVRGTA